MKTDSIFYSLFQLFPELLFELIGADPTQAANYEFVSQEIKELTRRFDGLLLPRSDAFTDLLYFLEIQFQPKPNFYRRLFNAIFAYLEQYEPLNNWGALAIFASRNLDPELSDHYLELRPRLRVVYLDEIVQGESLPISLGIVKLILVNPESVKEEFPKLVAQLEQIQNRELERRILDFVETILFYKFTTMSREEVAAMFGLDDIRGTKLYEEVKAEGKAEGELLGKLKAVPSLLALGMGLAQIAQALELEVAAVEQIATKDSNSN
ncbi:MAG: Rpn family recombination-promoting nuclease/putative transposase [Coleofasciculaceae cyanobacterium SM2_1_6]|nr:Rpn family recombination-promoting nuclease/putative transposase [Coleofasciculaceae cyanobacterium SM2_1_6]